MIRIRVVFRVTGCNWLDLSVTKFQVSVRERKRAPDGFSPSGFGLELQRVCLVTENKQATRSLNVSLTNFLRISWSPSWSFPYLEINMVAELELIRMSSTRVINQHDSMNQ